MTRNDYINYWTTWLRRTNPSVQLDVNHVEGTVVMIRNGVKYFGQAMECACGNEECLGWAMATVKERIRKES
jgi:hypothetical protein